MGKVLVVEDELSIQRILEFELKQAGFHVELASDGVTGLEKAQKEGYDIVLLDVMLPGLDGFAVCREIRKTDNYTHIIMLSARDEEFNRIMGLEMGADDYMTKPFSSREVAAKVKSVLRRKQNTPAASPIVKSGHYLHYKGLRLDTQKIEVKADGKVLDFTLKEYELLAHLLKNKNIVQSRDMLLDRLWGADYFGEVRVVDVHIFKVRDKLKPFGIKIKTVRGVGYMIEDEQNE